MAEAATSHTCRATYCFGCGNEVKPENRRKLDNEEAKNVVLAWKAFLEDEGHLIGEDVSLDAILNGEDSQRPPKMCRKCFNSYKKYFEFHQTIKQKLTKAIEVLELSPCSTLPLPSSSRPKKSRSLSWPTREQSFHNDMEPSDENPEVEVGRCNKCQKMF